jgi:hypothetical protein
MTATPPIVDRETWQKQIDTQRVREKAHTREGTRSPRVAGGYLWSRSTRRRRWSAPPAGSRSSTPSRSRSQQFASGPVGGSPIEQRLNRVRELDERRRLHLPHSMWLTFVCVALAE